MTVYDYELEMDEVSEPELELDEVSAPGLEIDSQIVIVSGAQYEGSYSVTPRLDAVVLPTAGLVMRDDLTVEEIPVSRVTNPQDGLTVIIG